MLNTDSLYLFVLGAAGIFAVHSMDKRPRAHILEGMTDSTASATTELERLLKKITEHYEMVESTESDVTETNPDALMFPFNALLTASSSNINGIRVTTNHQTALVELRQTLADIYILVKGYSVEQDTIINEQQARLSALSEMEELNKDTIKDTTNTLLEQGRNKRRLIQNNEYFLNRYRDVNDIVRYLILFIVLFTFIQYISIKGLLGTSVSEIISPLFVGVAIFVLWYKYTGIIRRNPADYDEIMWNDVGRPDENKNADRII